MVCGVNHVIHDVPTTFAIINGPCFHRLIAEILFDALHKYVWYGLFPHTNKLIPVFPHHSSKPSRLVGVLVAASVLPSHSPRRCNQDAWRLLVLTLVQSDCTTQIKIAPAPDLFFLRIPLHVVAQRAKLSHNRFEMPEFRLLDFVRC